jgi:large subunit ribosomal protein L29
MKMADLREKSPADLKKILIELRTDLFRLRMQKGGQQVVRQHLVGEFKKTIARIKTFLTENKNAKGESK